MTKVRLLSATLLLLAVAGLTSVATAGESAPAAKHATFEGKLVCLGCDLKTADGARAACKTFGHDHALKTKDGKYITFLPNQYSKPLIEGEKYHNQEVSVHGIFHAKANTLDVETFTASGKQHGWCGHCKAMDGCPFKSKGKM